MALWLRLLAWLGIEVVPTCQHCGAELVEHLCPMDRRQIDDGRRSNR